MQFYYQTQHSKERSKERKNLNEKKAERDIYLAWIRGKEYTQFVSNKERKYLNKEDQEDVIKKAYDGYCYVFKTDGLCLTMYELPRWFNNKKRYDGKKKIRDAKKYIKYYPEENTFWQEQLAY